MTKNKNTYYVYNQLSEREIEDKGFGVVQNVYKVDVICKNIDGVKTEIIPSAYNGIYEVKVYHKIFWIFKLLNERYYETHFIAHIPSKSHAIEVQSTTPYSFVRKDMNEMFEWAGTITSSVRIYI